MQLELNDLFTQLSYRRLLFQTIINQTNHSIQWFVIKVCENEGINSRVETS
jgi:hypothetical protein